MRGAESAVCLPIKVVDADWEVETVGALWGVDAALGGRADEAGRLVPPWDVGAGEGGSADDAVVLEPPWDVRAIVGPTDDTLSLPFSMPAYFVRPRTAHETPVLVPIPSTLCQGMRTS